MQLDIKELATKNLTNFIKTINASIFFLENDYNDTPEWF